ncbi:MAG: hypothetical protein HeimC3_46320 [Candidatus Heimdallarchaeota archaeon LC_3]|nr:MAG: hypothetical protein HeimC3_46320 [Candidatus Heimdallarchaeota archaeon LC_3]
MKMEEIVTTRIEKTVLNQIDKFVSSGYFVSRSEAIRHIISKGISDIVKVDMMNDLLEEVEVDSEITDEELMKISKKIFDKPIAEIISENRER